MSSFRDVLKRLINGPKANPADYERIVGEALTEPVVWQGRQWAVTGHGIECRNGTYPIDACRLWEEEGEYGWIRHLAEKEWVDLEDFIIALGLARTYHQDLVRRDAEVG